MKRRIDRIIDESINKVLNEAFQSNILRDLHNSTPLSPTFGSRYHGSKDFVNKIDVDSSAHGIPGNRGLYSENFLDKITDDMIDVVGDKNELLNMGFHFGSHGSWFGFNSQEVYDYDNNRRYAIILNNGKMIVFKNDPGTVEKLRRLSNEAGEKKRERRWR